MSFTYSDEDEQRIIASVTDQNINMLIQLLFDCASHGPGLNEEEFSFIEQISKEIK